MARKSLFLILLTVLFHINAWSQGKNDKSSLDAIPVDMTAIQNYELNPQKYLNDERLLRYYAIEFAKMMYVSFSKQMMASMNLTETPVPREYLDVIVNYLKTQPAKVLYPQVKNAEIRYRLLISNFRMAAIQNLIKKGFIQQYLPDLKFDTILIQDYLSNPYRYWQPENISMARKYFVEVYNAYYADRVIGTMRRFKLSKSPISSEFYERTKNDVLNLSNAEILQSITVNDNIMAFQDNQLKIELISRLLEILFDKLNISTAAPSAAAPQAIEEISPAAGNLKGPLGWLIAGMFLMTWVGMFFIHLKGGAHRSE